MVETVSLLQCEYQSMRLIVKDFEGNRGIAQNLMQSYTATERKHGDHDSGSMEFILYGIVTAGQSWCFINFSGLLKKPTEQISKEYFCSFDLNGDISMKKHFLFFDHRILKLQADKDTNQNRKNEYFDDERDKQRKRFQ
ncbi:37274_t:CDS:2 [Gigaspora margarita]|uniref:37274_t:CDS:1 n=1 Tax=Gigaspora margarita TaxID=4874 RepID=A0ABN7V216_GIGMA|nr:37274_t:CDS:2 [Gigaspora margarita]